LQSLTLPDHQIATDIAAPSLLCVLSSEHRSLRGRNMPLIAELLSQVKSTQFRWLWEPFIPCGKLVLLDGDPGVGKSLLTIDLAARLTRGGALPDGKPVERPQTAIIVSSEDAAGDTIRPRAIAAG